MSKVFYKEEQAFNQAWIWIIILLLGGLWLWEIVQQIFMGIPFGNNPVPDLVVILTGIFPLGAILLFKIMKLETIINEEGVHYRFKPFQSKARIIKAGNIQRFDVKKYKPIKDYGGWGIRWGNSKNGTAYNVSGNQGVLFELKNGKKFMLGTQNPASIKSALNKLVKQSDV